MAEVVHEMPPKNTARRGSKWDRYFDGQVWKLGPKDYAPVEAESARANAVTAARRRGFKLKTRVQGSILYVQAVSAERPLSGE